jgi:hypothetical protein
MDVKGSLDFLLLVAVVIIVFPKHDSEISETVGLAASAATATESLLDDGGLALLNFQDTIFDSTAHL